MIWRQMQTASHRLDHWPSVIRRVSSLLDLDASARHHKALLRKRGVRSAADLLHLGLLYGPGGLSLRSVASHATEAGIAELGDVSLLDRLRQAGDFLLMCWAICWPTSRRAIRLGVPKAQSGGRLDRLAAGQ